MVGGGCQAAAKIAEGATCNEAGLRVHLWGLSRSGSREAKRYWG